jgi:hypothetical protein
MAEFEDKSSKFSASLALAGAMFGGDLRGAEELKAMAEFLWQHLTSIGVYTELIIEALSKDFVGSGRQGRHLKAVAE